ncbi:rhodanese-like domain-containing protein [Roseibacillus ishigakijimensis]|uniref:Rhodanese domain-containing protein n=1 Tax=Roseibacillus ishigakijimensis TaxID=454146 RepID=A0A934VL38_9BACT|nr:rhodanese-like domain-containing protein [Roseibacillus ishigakijimensis]MBK1832726.1 hypothetical protein [Roseibacillus ishigakijimensis]
MISSLPDPDRSMKELLREFPSARRALFADFHIGGCQSCAFSEEDTLAEVCRQHELAVTAVQETILRSHEQEQALLVPPLSLKEEMRKENPPLLVDVRTREEHEAVALPGSQLLTESTLGALTASDPTARIILYDHTGKTVLDQVSWFRGHGLKETFALAGGIDAYAREADPSLPRYRLELD